MYYEGRIVMILPFYWLGKLPHQKYPISWLIKKFMPVNGWTEEDIKKLEKYVLQNTHRN